MYITIGVLVAAFILVLIWLFATVDDWSRNLKKNWEATSASAKNPSLHPIISPRPAPELAELVVTAARQLPGWVLAGREETPGEIALRFVRTTRLMRFKDDIIVYIRPAIDNHPPALFEVSAKSQSRVGTADFGQNPRNLGELMDTLRVLLR